jgi:hypothetical protein
MRRSRRLSGWYLPALCLLAGACSGANSGSAGGTGGSSGAATGGGGGGVSTGSGGSGSGDSGVTPTGSGGGASGGASGADDGGAGGMGSGGVGPAVDAGGMGGFGYQGASRCASAGVLLCEDFENGLDSAVWTTLAKAGDGTAVIDDMHAFRGTKALHIKTTTVVRAQAAISETKTFPIANNVLFARMYLWFDTFTTNVHFTLAEVPQTAAGLAWIRFGGQFGKFGVGTDHGASKDWLQPDTVPVPTKKWTCIEFEFKGDTNEFHVWQDDVARPALDTGATKKAGFTMPPFTSLWFGWQTYSNEAPGEYWIDEIAVDSKPIGCAK